MKTLKTLYSEFRSWVLSKSISPWVVRLVCKNFFKDHLNKSVEPELKTKSLQNLDKEIRQKEEIIPKWMKTGKYKMSLDKFYTKPTIAEYCYNSLLTVAKKYGIDTSNYVFVEPSSGNGVFLKLLPKTRRIGMDLKPDGSEITEKDYFDWTPDKDKKYITIGNPPFGLRGWLALAFINKAAEYSDLVGFILPMYFASDGKGSAKKRVKGLTLLHSEELPADIYMSDGKEVKINTVWQVWGKVKMEEEIKKTCNNYVDIYTVCTSPARRCGLDKMSQYAFFIQSTFYPGKTPGLCKKFEEVKYGSGYGVITKANVKEIEKYLGTVDWVKYSTRATNHCRHIGRVHIVKAMVDGGFVDC